MDWQAIEAGRRRPVGAAQVLGRRIVSGDITPGTTLPNLEQLAEQFAISRLSMREAIKLLAGKGLVSSAPRRGTVVRPRNEWSRLDPDVLVWQIGEVPNAAFVRSLFELRRMVEPEAAALAAERAPVARRWPKSNGRSRRWPRPNPKGRNRSRLISRSISASSEGTGNEFLAALAPAIEASLMLTFSMQRQVWPDPKISSPPHGAVMDAIKRGDPAAARAAMHALLARAELDAIDAIRHLGAEAMRRGSRKEGAA